jgi:hypothetical protein
MICHLNGEAYASYEIYVFWEGDQEHPSEFKSRITTEELASKEFVLEEKTYYELA